MDKYLDLYIKSNNPLENDKILENVIKAFIAAKKNGSTTFYNAIEKVGAERKKTNPPPLVEKDRFWSTLFNKWKKNILSNAESIDSKRYDGNFKELVMQLKEIPNISSYDELCSIVEKYPIISKYGIMPRGDRIWNFVLSRDIGGKKENDINPNYRLYINSEASDTYQIVSGFISKCAQRKLPYYLKFIEYAQDYQERADSIVIWADEKTLFKYIAILNELGEEIPKVISRCKEPPLLTMKINNFVGFGEEPKDGSYTSARTKLLSKSIEAAIKQWIIENKDRKLHIDETNFSVEEYITAKSIKDEFDIIKREIQRNPKTIASYGVTLDSLNKELYIKLCSELVNKVIPTIESNSSRIKYNEDEKKMSFDFDNAIYDILERIMNLNECRSSILEKVRRNIKLNSKQNGIDADKFIFNDDYFERIKKLREDGRE